MLKKIHFLSLMALCAMMAVLLFSGCTQLNPLGPEVTDYFTEEYQTVNVSQLRVSTVNGQMELYGWNGSTVAVNAVKRTRMDREELDKVTISVTEEDDTLVIEAIPDSDASSWVSIDMNIKVPSSVTVNQVTTTNGAIQLSKVKGNVSLVTSNGAIVVNDLDGYVSATTSNGHITVENTTGVSFLQTSNGGITAEVAAIQDDLDIITSNGQIIVSLSPAINAELDLKTSNGRISLSGISLTNATYNDRHTMGTLGEGGPVITIQTSNGNITINKL
jgi:hypothetical protein